MLSLTATNANVGNVQNERVSEFVSGLRAEVEIGALKPL